MSSDDRLNSKLMGFSINNKPNKGAELPEVPSFSVEEYPMNNPRRGKAIIFNHSTYSDKNQREREREGCEKDERRLEEEFEELGFEVDIQTDKTVAQIQKKLKEVSKENHEDVDCLIVVAISHGRQVHPKSEKRFFFFAKTSDKDNEYKKFSRQEIMAHDKGYDENELFKHFEGDKCPDLMGKPKLFFIEACRSDNGKPKSVDAKVLVSKSEKSDEEKNDTFDTSNGDVHFFPNAADFFIFRATVDGSYSVFNTQSGSYFIQILCDELKDNRERKYALDLESLSINVRRKMAQKQFNLEHENSTQKSQIPTVHTTLIRKLYLRPKDKPKENH